MSRKIIGPSSLFDISLGKYILRKDVYYAKSMIIKRDKKHFETNHDLIEEKDGIVTLKIPIAQEGSEGITLRELFRNSLFDLLSPKIDENIQRDFFLYKRFIWGMDLNPNFYRYIVKQTKDLEWVKNHRSELAYLLLFDILSEQAPTIQGANIELKQDYQNEDRTRQRRLLRNEYYPELFFEPTKYFERGGDERVGNYSTLFTENLNFGEEYMEAFQLTMALNQQVSTHLPSQKENEWWDHQQAYIKMVSAEEVRDIINFGTELNEILDRVQLRISWWGGDRKLIVDEIRRKTDIIEEFRALLNMAVYLRWFNRKTPEARQRLLEKKRRLSYTKSEAQEIAPLLMEYCDDPELVSAYLYFGAKAFSAIGKPQYAELLMNERRKQ